MKKSIFIVVSVLLFTLLLPTSGKAQMYVDDGRTICCGDSILNGNYLALGINPAHLGRVLSVKKGTGFLQVGGTFYSHGLDLGQVLNLSLTDNLLDSTAKNEIINRYPPEDNFEYDGKMEISWLSYSYAHPKFGGFAVQLQDRFTSTATIPNNFLGLALLGTASDAYQNASSPEELLDTPNGTEFYYGHFRSLKIGYGFPLLRVEGFGLYGGVAYSRLFGIGYLNGSVANQTFTGRSSFSELYQLDYRNINIQDPNYQRQLISNAGGGNAFELGLSMDIADRVNISASIVDIGSLTFNKNVNTHSASTASIIDSLGSGLIDSYNAGEASVNLFNLLDTQASDEINVVLNTHARIGGTVKLGKNLTGNIEGIIPMRSSNLSVIDIDQGTVYGAVTWNPIPKVIYVTGGAYYNPQHGWRMPFGASVGLGPRARLSISTVDLATLLGADDPMASLSITFMGNNW